MMRLAVCDNEIEECILIKRQLEKCGQNSPSETYEIHHFTSGEAFLEELRKDSGDYDMVFMDVYMDGMNGIEAARAARKLSPMLELVFITTSREFAVEAFQIQALHYLVKPVTLEQLGTALDRYRQKKGKIRYLEVAQGRNMVRLRFSQIHYLQSRNNGTDIFIDNHVLHVNLNTSALIEQMDGRFLSIRRGMCVNMSFIKRMDADQCVLKNGEIVLLSRKERADIRSRYREYIFGSVAEEEVL